MGNPGKRQGSRDISDLKARLGLKKGGKSQGEESGAASAGNPLPSQRTKRSTFIPAPPGVDDPNAYSEVSGSGSQTRTSTTQSGPDIVVVNDGNVERLEKESGRKKLMLVAGTLVVGALIGAAIGAVGSKNGQFNDAVSEASAIAGDIKKTRMAVANNVQSAIDAAKSRGPGGSQFLPFDKALTDSFEGLGAVPVNVEGEISVYKSKVFSLSKEEVPDSAKAELLGFYADVRALNEKIKNHVAKSRAAEAVNAKSSPMNPAGYAGLINLPKDATQPVNITLVKIGNMICPGSKAPQQNCGGQAPTGFQYSKDLSSSNFSTKNLATASDGNVSSNSLAPINPGSAVFQQLIKGGGPSVLQSGYMTRIQEIDALTETVLTRGKGVEEAMNKFKTLGKKFSFFM